MKILIADNDHDGRVLASIAFKELKLGHDIDFVSNSQELIEYLQSGINLNAELPNLILLGMNMPGKDGRVALKEIKSNPQLKHLDIIIFSTSSSEADKKFTLGLGAKNYIVKPFGYNELLKTYRNICSSLVEKGVC